MAERSTADPLLRYTGGRLAQALARQAADVMAAQTFTDEQIDDAASAALAAVVSSLSGGSGEVPAGLTRYLEIVSKEELAIAHYVVRGKVPVNLLEQFESAKAKLRAALREGEVPAGLSEVANAMWEGREPGTPTLTHGQIMALAEAARAALRKVPAGLTERALHQIDGALDALERGVIGPVTAVPAIRGALAALRGQEED